MSRDARRALLAVIGLGAAVRLVIAFATRGTHFDIDSIVIVQHGLADHGLDVYSAVNGFVIRWPYPPGYFPVAEALRGVADLTGIELHRLLRLPPIAADLGLAWLVQHLAGRRGAPDWARVGAAAAIALGPVFVGVSSYQGQIDSVAILPALGALALWERPEARRPLAAGLLIGLGAAVKTAPILMLVALAPSARSRRELGLLGAGALAVPLLTLVPFALSDPHGVEHALRYHGLAGLGGLSLVLEPRLALDWLAGTPAEATGFAKTVHDGAVLVLLPALAALAVVIRRRRIEPAAAAALVWLVFYVFGVSFLMQYLVWGLPFFVLVAGWRVVLALQVALTPALLLVYLRTDSDAAVWALYTVPLIALWLGCAVVLARAARRPTASRAA